MASAITHSELLARLHYDPETGIFTALRSAGKRRAGTRAGFRKKQYLWVGIDGRVYSQHRLAWFYVHREWPLQIDHANRDGMDNRISNLRPCTHSQNIGNTRAKSKTLARGGYKGVYQLKTGKYQASCGHQFFGLHDTAEAAALAYNKAATERYGEFAFLNKIPQRSSDA